MKKNECREKKIKECEHQPPKERSPYRLPERSRLHHLLDLLSKKVKFTVNLHDSRIKCKKWPFLVQTYCKMYRIRTGVSFVK